MKRILPGLFLGIGLVLTAPLHAAMNHAGMDHTAMSGMQSDGVVRKVDKRQGKLTLRHGPLENLGMPAMTMVFRVSDPAWLDQVKPGDNVRFRAERVNGMLTATHLEVVQ
jgi:Cu/Ag efflux protein CusF